MTEQKLDAYERDQKRYRSMTGVQLVTILWDGESSNEDTVLHEVERRLKFLERIIEIEGIDERDWDEDFDYWLAHLRRST